ncbi:hypothetical protein, partial [Niabella terrae]
MLPLLHLNRIWHQACSILFIATKDTNIDYKELSAQKDTIIAELQSQMHSSQLQVESLQLQIRELKRMIFGSRAEKFVSDIEA